MSLDRLSERSGGVIGTIGPIGGSGVFSLQERYALTADNYENVSLYLKMNGANGSTTFYDSSLYGHAVTANGNAQISTAQSKFGGASGAFDGTGDYLTVPDDANFNLSGGTYTVEAWIRPNGNYANYRTIVAKRVLATNNTAWQVFMNVTNGVLGFFNGTIYLSSATPVANEWSHVAAVFDSTGNINLYLNGVSVHTASTTNVDVSASVLVGWSGTTTEYFNGYIDDLRITKGVARYTANFTPPQREFRP